MIPLIGIGLRKRKRRNLYLSPSFCRRLLALPFSVGRQRQKPTLVYAISAFGNIPHGTSSRKRYNYITTGIYHCLTLDRE